MTADWIGFDTHVLVKYAELARTACLSFHGRVGQIHDKIDTPLVILSV